jgi:hypothetical protein
MTYLLKNLFNNPTLIQVSKLKEELGLSLTDEELKFWPNGKLNLSEEQRISIRYAYNRQPYIFFMDHLFKKDLQEI